jgi:hypothetical protein
VLLGSVATIGDDGSFRRTAFPECIRRTGEQHSDRPHDVQRGRPLPGVNGYFFGFHLERLKSSGRHSHVRSARSPQPFHKPEGPDRNEREQKKSSAGQQSRH